MSTNKDKNQQKHNKYILLARKLASGLLSLNTLNHQEIDQQLLD